MAINSNCSSLELFGTSVNALRGATRNIEIYKKELEDSNFFFDQLESSFSRNASLVQAPLLTQSEQNALRQWTLLYTSYLSNEGSLYRHFPNGGCFDCAFSSFKKMVERLASVANSLWKSFFNAKFPGICREDSIDTHSQENALRKFSTVKERLTLECERIRTINKIKSKEESCNFMSRYSIGIELGHYDSI